MIPVIFDLDGTLVDSLSSIHKASAATLEAFDLDPLAPSVVAGFVGWGERVFVQKMIAATKLSDDDFDAILRVFMANYAVTSTDVQVFPGAIGVLETLRAAGHPTGLCTNKPGGPTKVVLKSAGLDALLDVVCAGDTLAVRKPDPAPLRHLLSELGAESCIYVGDTLIDAETAERAGVPFLLFTEGIRTVAIEKIPHTASFTSFDEFPEVLQRVIR